jgi:hypothetical protein
MLDRLHVSLDDLALESRHPGKPIGYPQETRVLKGTNLMFVHGARVGSDLRVI